MIIPTNLTYVIHNSMENMKYICVTCKEMNLPYTKMCISKIHFVSNKTLSHKFNFNGSSMHGVLFIDIWKIHFIYQQMVSFDKCIKTEQWEQILIWEL